VRLVCVAQTQDLLKRSARAIERAELTVGDAGQHQVLAVRTREGGDQDRDLLGGVARGDERRLGSGVERLLA
jgi:hypothetical protein